MPLKIVQTAAVLEVVHSMIGLVSSPWQTALMQGKNKIVSFLYNGNMGCCYSLQSSPGCGPSGR
jgi:hypothetical protein